MAALLGCGHAGDDDIDLARLQGRDQRHEFHVVKFNRTLKLGADDTGKFAVMAADPAIFVDETERLPSRADPDFKGRSFGRQLYIQFFIRT